MNYDELTAKELLGKLEFAGRYPNPELINTIWERRPEVEPLMLALFGAAYGDDWDDEDDPRWYRFVHAGQFLLSWQVIEALPVFADLFMNDALQDLCDWFEEDLFQFGPAAIPYLQRVVEKDSGGEWHYGRGLSSSTLSRIAVYYPKTRDEVMAIFRAQLPPQESIPSVTEADELWGNFAFELGQLADESSRDHILALSDADLLSLDLFDRQAYLHDMERGYKPEKLPEPYDVRDVYRDRFEWNQRVLRENEKERQRQRESHVRIASPRSGPKIGRNEPCPCGSGKKYKKCHGRPGT